MSIWPDTVFNLLYKAFISKQGKLKIWVFNITNLQTIMLLIFGTEIIRF